MTFSRRPETGDNQGQRETFRERAAAADVTVLHCRIPTELHRRLRHLMVDEGTSVTALVIELSGSGAAAERPLGRRRRLPGAQVRWCRGASETQIPGSVRAAHLPPPSQVQAAAQREQASLVMGEAGVLAQYDHGVMPAARHAP